jgi:general secretion pathway protein D
LRWVPCLQASRGVRQIWVAAVIGCCLLGCSAKEGTYFPSTDALDSVRTADLKARFPTATPDGGPSGGPLTRASRPMLAPGTDPILEPGREEPMPGRGVNAQNGAVTTAAGIEFNFENADVQTVARTLLGDTLGLSFVVDPRVQGAVTLASVGPIARKDVLPTFENVLRMSNAALVQQGNLVKIVPVPEAAGAGAVSLGAGQPGYGVSVVPLRYTSAASVAHMAENFLSRPGAIRADPARNLLLIQGTSSERQSALDVVATFDVEWLRNQSVGVYPLKSTSPETMIHELERVFETSEGGQGQGVVQFQPISRMNAVMVVARSAKLLERVTTWVQRLDRSDVGGNALRTYRLKFGNAQRVAKILNDIFVGRSGASAETPANQIAPGAAGAQSRLDSLGQGAMNAGATTASTASAPAAGSTQGTTSAAGTGSAGPFNSAFEGFENNGRETENNTAGLTSGNIGRGLFPNVRVTADVGNNSIIIYSNQEDYRIIERALRDLDRPQLQVAIDATVAEVGLTDDLQFGVQHFFTSSDLGLAGDKGSVGVFPAGAPPTSATTTGTATTSTTTDAGAATTAAAAVAQTVQTAFLQRVLPGFNLLLGPEAQPRVILSALSTITDVKVLSSPSLVVVDDQPALLEVGNQIPVSTSTTNVLSAANTIVSTIEMRNTGVILKVLPRIHANGVVQLEIEQEISNVVNPDQQTLTPTISQRRIHSTVDVTSGQTVLLGGLISEQQNSTKAGIPGLNQIKYLGDLFGNTSKSKMRSEIIVFIRPQVIRTSLDQQSVTEEFRQRLETMRNPTSVIEGKDVAPPQRAVISPKD